jgi:sugar phosphate isomerase/epimerase
MITVVQACVEIWGTAREQEKMMGESKIIYEFGLASDLFWDPLGESEITAVADHGFSFFEIWGHMPWFDIYSSSMASELKAMVDAHGMRIRSVHAPCEADWDISSENEEVRRTSVKEAVLSIERCREMGGELVVMHPGRRLSTDGDEAEAEHNRRIGKSIESFFDILSAAEDNGIRIAVENQWSNEVGGKEKQFMMLLDTLDPKLTGICFDSSHANITPGTLEMIGRLEHRIITTHLSDNHGEYDEHKPPFTASIDWQEILKVLLRKDFCGPWLMEVTNGGHDPLGILEQMGLSIPKMEAMLEDISCDL